jgi:hypothetical protein
MYYKVADCSLEPQICIRMSQGLPKAYIQLLEKNQYNNKEETYFYSIAEVESNFISQKLKPNHYIIELCKKVNKILENNVKVFMDEEYYETEGDRSTVEQIKQGVPFDKLK